MFAACQCGLSCPCMIVCACNFLLALTALALHLYRGESQ